MFEIYVLSKSGMRFQHLDPDQATHMNTEQYGFLRTCNTALMTLPILPTWTGSNTLINNRYIMH
jgi:hypothetical protein